MRRRYPEHPIVAVSGVVRDAQGRILLVRRARAPGRGKWSLPGGAVRLGEPVLAALRREIREECGIAVEVERLYGVFDRIFRDDAGRVEYHYVILSYLCRAGEHAVRPGSDTEAFRWIASAGALDEFDFTEGVRELLEEIFRL